MFNNFFKKNKETDSNLERIALTTEAQLEEILELSKHKTVLIFKHSTRCGISSMVLKRFENALKENENDFKYYHLDLLKNRDLSSFIAQKFEVTHQSPQLIVIKNKVVDTHNSHYGIMDVVF